MFCAGWGDDAAAGDDGWGDADAGDNSGDFGSAEELSVDMQIENAFYEAEGTCPFACSIVLTFRNTSYSWYGMVR